MKESTFLKHVSYGASCWALVEPRLTQEGEDGIVEDQSVGGC